MPQGPGAAPFGETVKNLRFISQGKLFCPKSFCLFLIVLNQLPGIFTKEIQGGSIFEKTVDQSGICPLIEIGQMYLNYLFFFLCRFLRNRFFRLWVAILCRFRLRPLGIDSPPSKKFNFATSNVLPDPSFFWLSAPDRTPAPPLLIYSTSPTWFPCLPTEPTPLPNYTGHWDV